MLPAQDARDLSTPVGNVQLVGVSAATINSTIAQGFRLTNITYRGTSILGTTFDAVFVQNTGTYAISTWWYYNQTAAQVSSNLTNNQARLIDLDPYTDSNGNQRFACIMVDNTGSHAKGWLWYYNTNVSVIAAGATANNARVIDFDRYTFNGTTYYSAVLIGNTGADNRQWWWYINITPTQIGNYLNTNNARLYDLEPNGTGTFDCVMIRDNTFPYWYWWYDLSVSDISYLIGQYGVRAIDLETYLVSGVRKWAMLTINNSNALTTSVGNGMRSATDGQVGLWLQRMNGGNLANLNGDTVFEPASTMKTLHHVHAMRRVYLGLSLTTPLTVYSNYQSAGSSCPIDTGPFSEQLQVVLNYMMDASDNARTQAIRAYFGESNINSTAAALGMTSTGLHHRIGCGAEAVANPNQITLRDLNTLHEQVVNGYLGSYRQMFYDIMRNDFPEIDTVISQEGASLGLSAATVTSFRNLTHLAHKKGGYGLQNGGPLWYDRSEFGWISLPFITNDMLTPREYGFGVFVNNSSTDTQAIAAVYQQGVPELLRSTIHSAMQSWNNSLASVSSLGAGCGSPLFTQSVQGLPRVGTTIGYYSNSAHASSIVLFALGFSNTNFGGIPLPVPLAPFGSDPGCMAYNDIQISDAALANAAGFCQFNVPLPNNTSNLGFQWWTQLYSFGPTTFKTSNAQHSVFGL
ncbi:MAG TPA: serine hydrolase [Planctomycetota bacterium]|nr:serine hydrolase [Planctomycetota bacterium]